MGVGNDSFGILQSSHQDPMFENYSHGILDRFNGILMGYFAGLVPSGKLTELWKITIFNGKIHYKWAIFNSYVKLPEGKFLHFANLKMVESKS